MGPLELPPLSLSTGPAISGGGTNASGPAQTGEFVFNRRARWQDRLALAVPVLVLGGVLWMLKKS